MTHRHTFEIGSNAIALAERMTTAAFGFEECGNFGRGVYCTDRSERQKRDRDRRDKRSLVIHEYAFHVLRRPSITTASKHHHLLTHIELFRDALASTDGNGQEPTPIDSRRDETTSVLQNRRPRDSRV